MKHIKYIGLAILLSTSLTFTAPAKAGNCCNSFWSCLGAVATAGLSCAVQAAVDEIQEILQHARDLFSMGQRVFDESIGTLNDAVVNATRGATDSFASVERSSNAHRRQASEISTRVDRDYDPSRAQLANTRSTARPAAIRTSPTNPTDSSQINTTAIQTSQSAAALTAQANRQISTAAAQQIANSAGTSTIRNTPSRAEMQAAMRAALQRVNQLADKTGRDERSGFEQAMRGLERAHQTAVNHMRDVFSVSFAAPISGVIGPLAATIADPVSFLITARTMNLTLDRVTRDLERLFPPAISGANTQINDQMRLVTERLTTATNTTSEAGRIVNAMAELERNPTRYYFAQLNDLTGYRPAQAGVVARGSSATGSTVALAPTSTTSNNLATLDPELLRSLQVQFRPNITQQLNREMKNLSRESNRLQARLETKQNTQQYEVQLDRYWDNYFKGKSKNEMASQKRQLTNEINQKFSKDPEARNKALQLLNQQENKYSAMRQSTPLAVPEKSPQQGTIKSITHPNQPIKPMQPNSIKPVTNSTLKPIGLTPISPAPTNPAPVKSTPSK
ncbi:MAG: hypothetical protein K6L75_13260 [Cellvibrionaceae bacterium]